MKRLNEVMTLLGVGLNTPSYVRHNLLSSILAISTRNNDEVLTSECEKAMSEIQDANARLGLLKEKVNEDNASRVIITGAKGYFFDCDYDDYFDSSINLKDYAPRYRLKHEPDGLIFREIKSDLGLAGHTQTLEQQLERIANDGTCVSVDCI
ncbi:hypothetical protein KW507_15620 [Vibrio fluvialis]|nr:hypothetical protein [Vibrio fluvialis]